MRLVPTKINASLLLEECYFEDGVANIDNLVAQACTEQEAIKQLALLSRASKECDKFHSYFHFEESFFHFMLGVHCESLGRLHAAIKEYKNALISYPINKAAYAALIKLYERCSLFQELEILLTDMKTRGLVLDTVPKCNRPFSKFEHYVAFATNKQIADKKLLKSKVTANNFWLSFEEFEVSADIKMLKETIARAKRCHSRYHDNAALIYYNCALVYKSLGDTALANNMMLKAKSLNSGLTNTLDKLSN